MGSDCERERESKSTDSIASNSGKDVVVASIDEVEGDGVQRSLAFLDPVGDLELFLLR